MGHYATEMRDDDPEYYREMYARQCGEVVRLKLKVNALLDAIKAEAPRATAKRIMAAANATSNAALCGPSRGETNEP
jgi:hypothetical protein